ncbi:MAG: DapH/DapD/GlmU-related protein, partial [Bacteroidota bacterium]
MEHDPSEAALPHVAPTAQVHATARLDPGVEVGHFCVIEADVVIGAETQIGHHVVVRAGTQIGPGCRVDDHAVIGKLPMKAAASATTQATTPPPAAIGARCLIGAGVVLYAGCQIAEQV